MSERWQEGSEVKLVSAIATTASGHCLQVNDV